MRKPSKDLNDILDENNPPTSYDEMVARFEELRAAVPVDSQKHQIMELAIVVADLTKYLLEHGPESTR